MPKSKLSAVSFPRLPRYHCPPSLVDDLIYFILETCTFMILTTLDSWLTSVQFSLFWSLIHSSKGYIMVSMKHETSSRNGSSFVEWQFTSRASRNYDSVTVITVHQLSLLLF